MAKRAFAATNRPTKGAAGVTADDIVLAAVRICDEGGIESLTIRRLAADLNIGTMTLYGYFRGKDEILDGVADYVLGGFHVPPAREQTPVAVATAVGHAFLAMMREHPSVVYLLSSRATMSQQSLKAAMEDVLARLREAGFDGPVAVKIYAMLITYCLGFASYQHPRPWGRADSPNVSEQRRQRVHFYSSLPLPAFANMVELSESITMMPSDEQFDFGLKCLIDGLVAPAGTGSPPSSGGGRAKARAN